MNGYFSYIYLWVNVKGEKFWVKYYFKIDQGIDCMIQEEVDKMVGVDGDYYICDLYQFIEKKEFLSWILKM